MASDEFLDSSGSAEDIQSLLLFWVCEVRENVCETEQFLSDDILFKKHFKCMYYEIYIQLSPACGLRAGYNRINKTGKTHSTKIN